MKKNLDYYINLYNEIIVKKLVGDDIPPISDLEFQNIVSYFIWMGLK